MNPSAASKRPNPASRLLPLALALLPVLARASLWPSLPPEVPMDSPDPAFKFAAGLYHSQEALQDSYRNNQDLELLARAMLAASRVEEARRVVSGGMHPPPDLALQAELAVEKPLNGSAEKTWIERYRGDDGESLYWRARIAEKAGRFSESRRLLEELLRTRPASVFVPVSQERLASLPFEEGVTVPSPPELRSGFRIQWGVFRDSARARQLKAVLEAYGHRAAILPFEREGIPLSRVVSEPFSRREDAQREGDSLSARYGLDFVVFEEEATP